MDNRPIGIFDSGVGGLTALKAICDIIPSENVIYFGDTKHMPYGEKDKETVISYANRIINFLKSHNVKAILAACGTVSSYLEYVDKNVFGVINPACDEGVKLTKNKKIGILGTNATIKSNSYLNRLKILNSEVECYQMACPLLAPMIEKGLTNLEDGKLQKVLDTYISPLASEGVDTIILGCTHYPIVLPVIEKMFKGINLVNPGEQAGYALKKFLVENKLTCTEDNKGRKEFYVSGSKKEFEKTAKIFLGQNISIQIQKEEI